MRAVFMAAAVFVPYAFMAFILWDANPSNWTEGSRAFVAYVVAPVLSFVGVMRFTGGVK